MHYWNRWIRRREKQCYSVTTLAETRVTAEGELRACRYRIVVVVDVVQGLLSEERKVQNSNRILPSTTEYEGNHRKRQLNYEDVRIL